MVCNSLRAVFAVVLVALWVGALLVGPALAQAPDSAWASQRPKANPAEGSRGPIRELDDPESRGQRGSAPLVGVLLRPLQREPPLTFGSHGAPFRGVRW